MSGIARKLMGVTQGGSAALGYQHLTTFLVTAASGTFSHTYTDVDLGTPAANRHILGICWSSTSVRDGLDINTATFAGTSATRVINHNNLGGFNVVAYFLAAAPDGQTGDISWGGVFSDNSITTRQHISLYALYGEPAVVSSGSAFGSGTSRSVTLPSVDEGDVLIALAGNNASDPAHTYSPSLLSFDLNHFYGGGGNRRRSVVSGLAESSGSTVVQVNMSQSGAQLNLSTAAIRL